MSTRHFDHWPSGLPRSLGPVTSTILDRLDATASRHPTKACLVYYDTIVEYGQFKRESDALAKWLQKRGVRKGERVILYLQNSPQFAVAYYAVARAGAVVVPVNPMSRTAELAHYVANAGARVMVAAQELVPNLRPLLDAGQLDAAVIATYSDWLRAPTDLPVPEVVRLPREIVDHPAVTSWADAVAGDGTPAPTPIDLGDLCVMPYTSGTTGHPKGCMHSHRNVMFTAEAGMRWLSMRPDDVVMATVPLFHVTGMQRCLNGPIAMGNTIVLMTRWDAECAARLIERYRVTTWTGVPTMFISLLGNRRLERHDLSSLERIGGGGAAMPEAIAQRMRDRLGIPYVEGYGLSETIAPALINPPQRSKKQCLGIPIFDTQARIVTPGGRDELPTGETGEILIAGPQVFAGYWQDEAATEAAFVDIDGTRFLRTGDLGFVDNDGYFFIVDRLKRMINASGFKVWPAEVEAMFYAHPAVHEVCVVGYPDAHRGETVKALVVLKSGEHATAEELIDWARSKMAVYKAPRSIEFVSELPKSETGKIQWRVLQEQHQAGMVHRSS